MKTLLAACSLLVLAAPAYAFDAECTMNPSEITLLREPEFSTSSVWDILYAEEGMDVFSDFVPLPNKEFVAAGSFTKDKDDKVYHPLLVKFDESLKPVWAVREDTKQQRTIHRMIKTKDGFTVLGDLSDGKRGNGIYIASYDNDGKVRGAPIPIYETKGDLDAKAFVASQDGDGYLVAGQFIDGKDQEKQNGILFKITKGGKVAWKRTYTTGQSTVFNNIQVALDGSYIITGQMVLDNNVGGAWLLRVDGDGSIKWQRNYPRGGAATFEAAAQTKEGEFIIVGKARPLDYDGKGLTAWVMKTDSTGNPLWQRYFNGPYDYEASDLITYEDGRASVLINAAALDADHRSHARLITFSPQGRIHHIEDFTDGQNSAAHHLLSGGEGERVIVGYAQTTFGEEQTSNEAAAAPTYTFDGWLIAATPLDVFEDPCASPQNLSPILQ